MTNAADGEVFSINTYKVQCDTSKQSYLDALESARNAYPAYIAALKGWKTATEIHAKDSTSQKFIDDYTGLGDWQNLLQRKHPKKNLRAWGAAENEFEFNLDDYAKVYEHSKGLYDTAKKTATSAKKTYLAACGSYEDIQQAYFNTLTTGEVGEDAAGEDDGEDADAGDANDGEDAGDTGDDDDAGADEAPPVTGKCTGNTDTSENVDCAGGDGTTTANTQNKGAEVTGSDAATCCEAVTVTGKCTGNTDTSENVDCAGGDGTTTANTQNKGSGVTGSTVGACCEAP